MAAGEIWVNVGAGYLLYRDSSNLVRTVNGLPGSGASPLGVSTRGAIGYQASQNRLVWNSTSSSWRYQQVIGSNPIFGAFVLGEIFVRGVNLYVATANGVANSV